MLGALLPTTSALQLGALVGLTGFVQGSGFAVALSVMERRRTLGDLTSRRAARWGFLVGTTVGLAAAALVEVVMGVGTTASGLGVPIALQLSAILGGSVSLGALTAGLAGATIAVAKRDPNDLALPPDGRSGRAPQCRPIS